MTTLAVPALRIMAAPQLISNAALGGAHAVSAGARAACPRRRGVVARHPAATERFTISGVAISSIPNGVNPITVDAMPRRIPLVTRVLFFTVAAPLRSPDFGSLDVELRTLSGVSRHYATADPYL